MILDLLRLREKSQLAIIKIMARPLQIVLTLGTCCTTSPDPNICCSSSKDDPVLLFDYHLFMLSQHSNYQFAKHSRTNYVEQARTEQTLDVLLHELLLQKRAHQFRDKGKLLSKIVTHGKYFP
jgi:hypothetical protein